MKKTLYVFMFLVVSIAVPPSALCPGQDEIALRQELSILKPLVGKTWVGEMKDPSGKMTLHVLMIYEPMHNGKVLKYYQETKKLNNRNEKEEAGMMLKYGYAIFPSWKLEFRNTLEITPDGKLVDKWFSFEDGEWKAGHSVIYTTKRQPES